MNYKLAKMYLFCFFNEKEKKQPKNMFSFEHALKLILN